LADVGVAVLGGDTIVALDIAALIPSIKDNVEEPPTVSP
jgi:hypothetical protein